MDKVQYGDRRIPVITRTGAHGDILHKIPREDENINAGETNFVQKNRELQGNLGSGNDEDVRKSTLVEIPTPTSRIVYRVNSLFPFDFFPDSLVVDELKVSFIFAAFLNKEVISILIKDITDVLVETNIFFGSVIVSGGDYEGNASQGDEKGPLTIRFLNRSEAYKARQIIMGLMIYQDQKVDTSKFSIPDLIQKTQQLGESQEV